jgi:hypothetical protein
VDRREGFMLDLDEIAREGARRMLARALEAEVQVYIDSASGERDERGHALVTKNGHTREREIVLGRDPSRLRLRRSTTGGSTRRARGSSPPKMVCGFQRGNTDVVTFDHVPGLPLAVHTKSAPAESMYISPLAWSPVGLPAVLPGTSLSWYSPHRRRLPGLSLRTSPPER